MTPLLSRIRVYPFKSLEAEEVAEIPVVGGAGLKHDREFRLVGEDGETLNSKKLGGVLLKIRSRYDFAFGELSVEDRAFSVTARPELDPAALEKWFSERLGRAVRVERNPRGGFPDDEQASGPTLVARSTLAEVASWFPGLDEAEARRRFRANLEIDGVPPFWEDRLFARQGETVRFLVGEVEFEGVNPSQRCSVPTRDSRSGEVSEPEFASIFARRREQSLPAWAEPSRFDHFYRLALNTRIPSSENGKILHVGDEVRLLS